MLSQIRSRRVESRSLGLGSVRVFKNVCLRSRVVTPRRGESMNTMSKVYLVYLWATLP